MPRITCFYFFVLACFLSSCGDNPYYQDIKSIDGSWSFADSLHFSMPAPDTLSPFAMFLHVEHTKDYPFQNMYVRLSTNFPSGRRASDLINIDLADKAGMWFGKCGSQTCVISAPLRQNFSFSEAGTYNITLEQYTRTENLNGVNEVGIELWQDL